MPSRPALAGPIAVQNAMRICSRCWQRLAPAPLPPRHSSIKIAMRTQSTVAHGRIRPAWSNDYFRANPVLSEAFWSPRREMQSSMAAIRIGKGQQTATEEVGATAKELLPHRRRKRAKEREAEDSETAYPIAPDASSKLATISSNLPQTSAKRTFTTYLSLSKPRLSFLVVLTATAAYSLYPVPELLAPAATSTTSLSTLTLLFLTTGTALSSASANAFNMLMEPEYDAKMSRTRNRPLVRKLVSPRSAMVFAVVCGMAGIGALYFGVNPTTAFLGGANIVLYAGIYTPMKRMSVVNTWVGAIVGGIPPLMGWTAAASQYASDGTWEELLFGESSVGGWLCAALLFAWQFPHFNSLSWSIREEYKHAGYRMLAWVNPAQNGRVALRYAILMFPVCVGLSYCGVTDWSFVATSSVINGWMVLKAYQFWKADGHKGTARGLFWASVWHLPIVMVLAMAQKKGLGERLYRSIFGYPEIAEGELYYETDELDEEEKSDHVLVSNRR